MRAVAGGRDPKYRAFGLDKIIGEGTEYYRVQMGDDSGGLGKFIPSPATSTSSRS